MAPLPGLLTFWNMPANLILLTLEYAQAFLSLCVYRKSEFLNRS